MLDIDNTQHDADCDCMECQLARPHPLAQSLTEIFVEPAKNMPSKPHPSVRELEDAVILLGDPSTEDGTDSIFFGRVKNGMVHGSGILLTILSKYRGYDSAKIDAELRRLGYPLTPISRLHEHFLSAGIQLHESEFPFLTLEGIWNEGELIEGNSFFLDTDNHSLPAIAYSGTWEKNLPNGNGRISYSDAVYSGEIKSGKKHGLGVLVNYDGRVTEGEWHQGLFHGFMKFNRVDGGINEQEYYQGEEIGPYVQTTYEDEEKIFSTLSADVEGLSVAFNKFWDGSTSPQSYMPVMTLGDAKSARQVKIEDEVPSRIPELDSIDVGDTIPLMAPMFDEKNWIMDQSDYVVKDSEDKILGWVKREGIPNQDSSPTKAFIVFPDLGYFQGVVGEDLLPNGQGTYTFPGNFAKISGKWKNGEISEGGIYVSDRILYHGNFSNGQLTLDGEYYIKGNAREAKKRYSKRNNRGYSKKEKEELRSQLVDNVGSDVWSKEKNFVDWDSKFSKSLSSIISVLNLESESSKIMQLLDADESQVLEFKSSVWASYNNATGELIPEAKKNLQTEDSIVKTIAAFCNTDGGTLVIGVQDRPETRVVGIDADLPHSGKQKDIESFQISLSEVIRKATGEDSLIGTNVEIKIEDYEGHRICVVSVEQTWPKNWVWASLKKYNKDGPEDGIFFVRSGPQTIKMSAASAHTYRTKKESSKS
jgi:hypothetical protein